jgi:hypothetical protein
LICAALKANMAPKPNDRFTEGFRTAALCRRAGTGRGAGVRKPRKEETAGRKRRVLAGRDLWGFWGRGRIAHVAAEVESSRCYRQERTRRAFSGARMRAAGVGAAAGESLRRSQGHRVPAPACGWRRRRSALRGGKRGDCHEVSILIRVGDGERAGAHAPIDMRTHRLTGNEVVGDAKHWGRARARPPARVYPLSHPPEFRFDGAPARRRRRSSNARGTAHLLFNRALSESATAMKAVRSARLPRCIAEFSSVPRATI